MSEWPAVPVALAGGLGIVLTGYGVAALYRSFGFSDRDRAQARREGLTSIAIGLLLGTGVLVTFLAGAPPVMGWVMAGALGILALLAMKRAAAVSKQSGGHAHSRWEPTVGMLVWCAGAAIFGTLLAVGADATSSRVLFAAMAFVATVAFIGGVRGRRRRSATERTSGSSTEAHPPADDDERPASDSGT